MDGVNNSITNQDVVINYTPSDNVISYSYIIIKNNVESDSIVIDSNIETQIILQEEGTYEVIINNITTNNLNDVVKYNYIIDKESPKIKLNSKTYKITENDEFNYLDYIKINDNIDTDLSNKITSNVSELDFKTPGIKKIEFSVSDSAGNVSKENMYVTVVKDSTYLLKIGQFSIILIVIVSLMLINKYINSLRYERRFSKYTINSSKNKSISLFDNIYNAYLSFIDKFSLLLKKSDFINKRSEKYNKYMVLEREFDSIKFYAKKISLGLLYLIVVMIFYIINSKLIKFYELILPFIIGFYTLDVFYRYKYYKYRKKLENDLLEAITLMNNAFKSGRSIIQAIDLVANELKSPIANEFKKISMELSFGLDIEIAFKRFSDRIQLEEAAYLTSSLSVLNKTGGNIVKVFDSIEKSLYSKKKLQTELKSLTSSSRMIMYVLIFIPIVFATFITIINRGYFMVLFKNVFGIILLIIMLIIYITYIIIVKRIMKVRM